MKKQTVKAAALMLLTLIALLLLFAASCSAQDRTKWRIYFEDETFVHPVNDSIDIALASPSYVFKVWEHESGCNDYFFVAQSVNSVDTFMVSYVPNKKDVLAFFQDGELIVFESKNR